MANLAFIRPTNYGNLVLDRYYDRSYLPQARAKERRLTRADSNFPLIWKFIDSFAPYPSIDCNYDRIYTAEGDRVRVYKFLKEGGGPPIEQSPSQSLSQDFAAWKAAGLVDVFQSHGKSPAQIAAEVRKAHLNNPIRLLDHVVVEMTGICNLDCGRCFRGGSHPSETGLPVELIKEALRPLLLAGVPHIDLTGGEPTLRMDALLEIVDFVKDYMLPDQTFGDFIGVISNGNFGQARKFMLKLQQINRAGLGQISLRLTLPSFDEKTNDKETRVPGSFNRVRKAVETAVAIGFPISMMAHNIGGTSDQNSQEARSYFEKHCKSLTIGESSGMQRMGHAARSELIPASSGLAANYFGRLKPTNKADQPGWCRCFAAPHRIYFRPNGNVGPSINAHHLEEQYGNLQQTGIVEIINGMADSTLCKMVANRTVETMQHLVDKTLFPGPFSKPCEAMVITLTFAQRYQKHLEEGMSPLDAQRLANQEAAVLTGYLSRA